MAATRAHFLAAVPIPLTCRRKTSFPRTIGPNFQITNRWSPARSIARKSSVPIDSEAEKISEASSRAQVNRFSLRLDEEGEGSEVSESMSDYFEQASVLVKSTGDGGGPRWFSPVECGWPRLTGAPLLLYLPGVDGVGLGLVRQHQKLGRAFELWCLHIPVMDRTPYVEMVKLVEDIVRSERSHSPKRPIYLVGESVGACLAVAVAARNPNIDFALILANPATSFSRTSLQLFSKSQLQLMISLVESLQMPRQSLFSDSLGLLVDTMEKGLGLSPATKDVLQAFHSLSSYFSVIADILPINTLPWKMEILKNACAHANSFIHAVKAQTLVLTSGKDPFLPSHEEGERLRLLLPKCDIRKFNDNGHFLFLEDGVDLLYTIKVTGFYRRGSCHDVVADFLPPTPSESRRLQSLSWWYDVATSPVMLSTLPNGEIVRGLAGFPSEGPTLLVGNHMLMGSEIFPMWLHVMAEKNIVTRGLAHPLMFYRLRSGKLPDVSEYDLFRLIGAIPVSGTNLFKLLASKSHVLMYPGGLRESLHRKGEEYQLFWPEESEFVRMAARFGTKIVPFGVVGEDDIGELVLDYDDLVRIPFLKSQFEEVTDEAVKLRTESSDEVSNQQLHVPGILPKIPGRFYFLFANPIETEGRREELMDRQKAQELYIEVKSEVERCIAYLKEKREHDPYRGILPRLLYQFTHKDNSAVPTFEI